MANCPNCGSGDIQLTKDTEPNWGAALVAGLLFGGAAALIASTARAKDSLNQDLR